MKAFKSFLDFYISSSIHVALSVFALSWLTLLEFDLPYDGDVLYFVFFASITGYNFVKFFGLTKFHHRSLASWLKVIQVFSLFCFLMMGYYALQLELNTIMVISIFALITFLYAMPLLPKRLFVDQSKQLRSISGLKVYIIALVWAGVTVGLPLLNANYHFDQAIILMGVQRFLFVLALMLPFEIRDLKYDSLKLATIPQQIGLIRTKQLGVLLLVGFVVLDCIQYFADVKSLLILISIAVITAAFIVFSKVEQSVYYSGFFVESIPIVWVLLTLIF